MEFNDAQKAVEYGAAHGALASTTPGDTAMATRKEVEKADLRRRRPRRPLKNFGRRRRQAGV